MRTKGAAARRLRPLKQRTAKRGGLAMTKRVYCREAIYREEYIVDVPDNLPEEEWEEYVLEELKALDLDPDDTEFSEYLDGAWFTDTWLTEN